MERDDQVLSIIEKLKNDQPAKALKKVSDLDSGMRFVLIHLADSKDGVYASTISEKMCISRARVGILLKKMENKEYITKSTSAKDGRIEVIKITAKGLKKCNEIKAEIVKNINKLIDEIGYDELNSFLDMADRIKNTIEGE